MNRSTRPTITTDPLTQHRAAFEILTEDLNHGVPVALKWTQSGTLRATIDPNPKEVTEK